MLLGHRISRKDTNYTKHLVIVIYLWFSSFKISRSQFVVPDDNNEPERLTPCHIPTGRPSFCVPTNRCPQIKALISNLKPPIPGDVGKYIHESYTCAGGTTVCCPFNNIVNKPENPPTIRPKGMLRFKVGLRIYKSNFLKLSNKYIGQYYLIIFCLLFGQMSHVQFKTTQKPELAQFILNAIHCYNYFQI